MPSGKVIHPGKIEKIEGHRIFVKILSQSACSSCHAKQACTMADMKEKIIEVQGHDNQSFHPGDDVTVSFDESSGMKAVFFGYVLPLIILVASIIIFLSVLKNEGLAALLALFMMVPYYFGLFLFRKKLGKEFRFRIE